jgi:hypothetical protein
MSTDIKCPNCGHLFPMEEAVSEEYKRELREKMGAYIKQKDEEFQKKEKELQQEFQNMESGFAIKLKEEKIGLQKSMEETIRKTIGSDFENKLQLLEQSNTEKEEKLRIARQKELEFLQKEQEFKNKEAELELSVQRKLQEERVKIGEDIRKIEEQKRAVKDSEYLLKQKELEKQLEDQKKLVDEMQRKAEQGSMQLQGEVQELALEELLKANFPFDEISEVGKGKRGADCIQTIRNNHGQECGKIIFESKRAENFGGDWIEKLKSDMRNQGADIAVIVTRTMPKDMVQFGEKNGVWICGFGEVKALVHVLREGILKIFQATKSQENRGDKMLLLYDYLTSSEFGEQWKAIREGFQSMKQSIQRERDAMEKLWKSREKQLEKVLLNAAHIRGSIDGIAGKDSIDLNLVGDGNEDLQLD